MKRLHEAADKLAGGEPVDLAELAQSLGYFDQAHFTRDFRKLAGKAPAEYRREDRQAWRCGCGFVTGNRMSLSVVHRATARLSWIVVVWAIR